MEIVQSTDALGRPFRAGDRVAYVRSCGSGSVQITERRVVGFSSRGLVRTETLEEGACVPVRSSRCVRL